MSMGKFLDQHGCTSTQTSPKPYKRKKKVKHSQMSFSSVKLRECRISLMVNVDNMVAKLRIKEQTGHPPCPARGVPHPHVPAALRCTLTTTPAQPQDQPAEPPPWTLGPVHRPRPYTQTTPPTYPPPLEGQNASRGLLIIVQMFHFPEFGISFMDIFVLFIYIYIYL